MLPVRCFTCNTVVGHLWKEYGEHKRGGLTARQALDQLNLPLMCCRRMLLSHVTVVDDLMVFSNENHVLDECGTTFSCRNKSSRTVECD